MGRSVNYLNNAEYVIYFTAEWINENNEDGNYDEYLSQINWEDFKSNLICEITSKLKSYCVCDKWHNNETLIFLENELCEIAISEYCGLYSLSIGAKDDEFYGNSDNIKEGIAKYHAKQIRKTLEKCLVKSGAKLLHKLGNFSNGEGVFEYMK